MYHKHFFVINKSHVLLDDYLILSIFDYQCFII